MLRLYKMSDSTVFKQKETGLGTSFRYFRAPVIQASHSSSVKNALIQILKGCIKRLKLVGNQVGLCFLICSQGYLHWFVGFFTKQVFQVYT